tara:strand:+ start:436 stop:612 length:177 start_codon:yes stop_codon:yes gene_type:complete
MMPEEFEHELIGVLQEHYGENFNIIWDIENEELKDGFYIRLKVWAHNEKAEEEKEDSN